MKKVLGIALLVLGLFSCEESNNNKIVGAHASSSGKLNNVSAVMDNDLWKGSVGETVRDVLSTDIVGLPQDEPMFTMNHIPTRVFTDFARKNRTVFKIERSDSASIKVLKNVYARPQKVVLVRGKDEVEIKKVIKDNSSKIIQAFKSQEISERQRQISKSLGDDKAIKDKLGISIKYPSIYRTAKATDNFFWLRKDIATGTNNLMLYSVPLSTINTNEELVPQIIKIRDSVSKIHIPGPTDGSYMKTEEAYSPYLFNTIIDNKPVMEMRSTWDVKDAFMAGPFLTFMVEDKENSRYLVAEGFAFAPSVSKRNYVFELEAIIRSISID